MSFLKSKHSGWTHELKRTPFGGGGGGFIGDIGGAVGDVFGGIGDAVGGVIDSVGNTIGDLGVGLDKTVGDVIPGGWPTIAAAAAAAATWGGSLAASGALEAGAIASADGIAMSTYGMTAAEALQAGVTAAELGLPAATTVAELAAVGGTASAEYLGLGQAVSSFTPEMLATANASADPIGTLSQLSGMTTQAASSISPEILAAANASADPIGTLASMTGMTTEAASAFTPEMIAAANASSDPIGMLSYLSTASPAEIAAATGGGAGSGTTLSSILGYAKTAAPIIGGLGKLAGGVMGIQAGNQLKQYGAAADPNSPYRAGYAANLNNLITNPNTVTSTPGYQFNLAQGLQAQQAQQAAQGRLVSGGALIQGQQFGQNLASQTYNQQVDTLAKLSGAYQAPAAGAMAQGGLAANALGATYGGWNSVAGGAGQFGTGLLNLYENYNRPSPNPTA
jgi:hypothetical protein